MKRTPFTTTFGLSSLCIYTALYGQNQRIYVDIDASTGGDGSSWTTSYKYLQDALASADRTSGTEIWIAAGDYLPNQAENTSYLDDQAADRDGPHPYFDLTGVQLYGGFEGTETELSQRVVANNTVTISGPTDAEGIPEYDYIVRGHYSVGDYPISLVDGGIHEISLKNDITTYELNLSSSEGGYVTFETYYHDDNIVDHRFDGGGLPAYFFDIDATLHYPTAYPNITVASGVALDQLVEDLGMETFYDAFVDETTLTGGVNELVEALYARVVTTKQYDLEADQNWLNTSQNAFNGAQNDFNNAQTSLNNQIAVWEGFTGVDYETEFDPGNSFHTSAETFLGIPTAQVTLADSQTALDTTQDRLDDAQADFDAESARNTLIKNEQANYQAAAEALLDQITLDPALATDESVFPLPSFFGESHSILNTPAGFSVFAGGVIQYHTLTLTAQPLQGYKFDSWEGLESETPFASQVKRGLWYNWTNRTGQFSGRNDDDPALEDTLPLLLPEMSVVQNLKLNGNRTIRANFVPDPDFPVAVDYDKDGLNVNVEATYGTSDFREDSNADGINDGVAVANNLDPTISYVDVIKAVQSDPSKHGLYTPEAIKDMRLGGVVLEQNPEGTFSFDFDIESSDDLGDWSLYNSYSIDIPISGDKAFLRMRLKE
jgi:hypothetical protein